MTKQAILS